MGNDNQNVTVNETEQQGQQSNQPTPSTQPTPPVQTEQGNAPQGEVTPSIADLMKENAELKVDNRRLKKANDSISSEISTIKKQLNAKMTEEELRAQQKSEQEESVLNELKQLRKEVALTKATKRYMTMKMPEDLAEKVAQAELDGDMELVTQSINSFMDAQKKETEEKVKADIYAKMPVPVSGNGDGQVDYEQQYKEKLDAGDITGAIHAQLMASSQRANNQ